MEFRRETDAGNRSVIVTLSSKITSRGDLFRIGGSGTVVEPSGVAGIRISGKEPWLVNPSFIRTSSQVEIFGESRTDPIELRISLHQPEKDDIGDVKSEVTFPSLSLLKAAKACVETDIERIPTQITALESDDAAAIWQFLNTISEVIRYEDYINIVEKLSEISPGFRFELSKNIDNQIRKMVVGWESNAEFRIESYDDLQIRITDFESLNTIKKLPESVDIKNTLANAMDEMIEEGTLDDIVELSIALSLPKHHPELLNDNQAHAIMARSLLEDNLDMAWMVAKAVLGMESPEDDRSFDQLVDEAIGEDEVTAKPIRWAAAVMVASGNYQTRTAISNYLYWTARTTDVGPQLNALLYEAAYEGFQATGVAHMAQYAKYNHHIQIGYRYRQQKEYDRAANQYLQAYIVASNANGKFDHHLLSQCITATHEWGEAYGDHHRYQGRYPFGKQVLETAMRSLEILGNENEKDIKSRLTELQAKRRVIEMDRQLTHSEYEIALETVGTVIRMYSELGDSASQNWAITTRREIQAIVNETNGDLADAAELHLDIGENGEISEGRQQWHIHRSDICAAKQMALNGHYEKAKQQLQNIKKRTNRLESEANDLAVVLDAVLAYQHGHQTAFQTSAQRLSRPDNNNPRVPPMRLEYNYEEPLAVVHAAQWLQGYNVDEELLTMAVEVALHASLIPLNAGEAAATIGLDEVELRNQWMNQLPGPVAQRIKQIELDRTVPQTDYVGLGSRLFNLVELYLAIFGEFYGTRKWGDQWRPKLSAADKTENMALGDLANVFNQCEEIIGSSDEAFRLVTGSGNTPSVTKLRNDIGHIKTDDVDIPQFERFYDRVMEVFQTTVDDIPVVGRKVETRGEGSFQRDFVKLQWWRSLRLTYIETEAEMVDGELYYFPQGPILDASDQSSVTIPADEIVEVATDRIIDKF